ncbi:holo-[acyl-carrier-protein] synthase [Paenibacillus nanensis]|uniref:Holo-[acyl-carrier-protein] synthase n=1 Tax=Paenibacillus nanensis TaxID=393251 RepID=A0A3A1UX59_9BACL|nr:holo-ACP synthase [Paenibacillus nanensis]RIX53107.1 holo-[acyl-carrier-protein] synthase [Paenibacillus nanensis]
MIIGIGHDLTDVTRISGTLGSRHGGRFLQRILTEQEQETARSYSGARLHQFVAGRFAAKEAISKAFGCGIGGLLNFEDMDIRRDVSGKPYVVLSEKAWEKLRLNAEETAVHLTITHEKALASAFAVVERIKP